MYKSRRNFRITPCAIRVFIYICSTQTGNTSILIQLLSKIHVLKKKYGIFNQHREKEKPRRDYS